jgi:hypothetical protein
VFEIGQRPLAVPIGADRKHGAHEPPAAQSKPSAGKEHPVATLGLEPLNFEGDA